MCKIVPRCEVELQTADAWILEMQTSSTTPKLRALSNHCVLHGGKLELSQNLLDDMRFARSLVRYKTTTKLEGTFTVRGARECSFILHACSQVQQIWNLLNIRVSMLSQRMMCLQYYDCWCRTNVYQCWLISDEATRSSGHEDLMTHWCNDLMTHSYEHWWRIMSYTWRVHRRAVRPGVLQINDIEFILGTPRSWLSHEIYCCRTLVGRRSLCGWASSTSTAWRAKSRGVATHTTTRSLSMCRSCPQLSARRTRMREACLPTRSRQFGGNDRLLPSAAIGRFELRL